MFKKLALNLEYLIVWLLVLIVLTIYNNLDYYSYSELKFLIKVLVKYLSLELEFGRC